VFCVFMAHVRYNLEQRVSSMVVMCVGASHSEMNATQSVLTTAAPLPTGSHAT
jgi:hypothetical protein